MARDEINAFLGVGTTYEGKLSFQGSVRIDGNFHGEIESEGTLIVGKDAHVQGTFRVGQLVLSGRMQGEVIASARVVLNRQAYFKGSLGTPILVVEEGATLQGRINFEEGETQGGGDNEKDAEHGGKESLEVIRIANT